MKPQTTTGRLALWLGAAFGTLVFLFVGAVSIGERGGDDFFDNLRLTVPILGAWLAAVGGGMAGLFAIVKEHERSPLVFGVVVLGLLSLTWGVLEILFPH
ncbi:MAG: hypothetical protein GY929_03760 [Actinomycetia bacterium]|nr:hypothetical protein [Actinomycetes bacterium]